MHARTAQAWRRAHTDLARHLLREFRLSVRLSVRKNQYNFFNTAILTDKRDHQ